MTDQQEASAHVFMALTNVKEGREADFTDWYNTEHVPDVVAVECYQSARRFKLISSLGVPAPWQYLSFYRFVGPVPDMHEMLSRHGRAGLATLTDALVDDDGAWIYSPIDD